MSARKDRRPVRDPGDADAVRRRQLLLFSVVAAVVLAAVAAWLGMGGGKERAPEGGIEAEIAGPDAAEKVWTRRSEARLGGIETQIRELRQEARTLRADNDRLRATLERDAADARSVIDRQAALIDELRRGAPPPAQPGAAPGSGDYFRAPASAPAPGGQARPAAPLPGRMIETFELEGAPQSSIGRSPERGPGQVPHRSRAGGGCGREAGLRVAAGGRPCRGGGAGRGRCLGRGLFPGRSPPGADAHHGPRLDRRRGRDGDAGRRRGLHRHWRGAWRPLLGEGLCALPHHDLRRSGTRHGDRDRRGRLRRRLRQDRRARPGGEPRGRAGREGVPRRHGVGRRPGRRPGVPAAGGGDRHRRGGDEHRARRHRARGSRRRRVERRARRSPTT